MKLLALAYENGISIGEAVNVSVTGIIVVLLVLALLAVLVWLLSKGVRSVEGKGKETAKKAKAAPAPVASTEAVKPVTAAAPVAPATTALPGNCSAGSLDLLDVDEKTAAVIMAIVSHESGIPLNRLDFKSIQAIRK